MSPLHNSVVSYLLDLMLKDGPPQYQAEKLLHAPEHREFAREALGGVATVLHTLPLRQRDAALDLLVSAGPSLGDGLQEIFTRVEQAEPISWLTVRAIQSLETLPVPVRGGIEARFETLAKAVAVWLVHPVLSVRKQVCVEFKRFGRFAHVAADVLVRWLDDPHPDQECAKPALEALCAAGELSLDTLGGCLSDKNCLVVRRAACGLRTISPNVAAYPLCQRPLGRSLVEQINDGDEQARGDFCAAFAALCFSHQRFHREAACPDLAEQFPRVWAGVFRAPAAGACELLNVLSMFGPAARSDQVERGLRELAKRDELRDPANAALRGIFTDSVA